MTHEEIMQRFFVGRTRFGLYSFCEKATGRRATPWRYSYFIASRDIQRAAKRASITLATDKGQPTMPSQPTNAQLTEIRMRKNVWKTKTWKRWPD